MSTIPFPVPQNASQARANMLHWASVGEHFAVPGMIAGPGSAAIEKAKMWAAVALALPEADTQVVLADDMPVESGPWGDVETPAAVDAGSGTETVDSRALLALRALAIRHIEHCAQTNRSVVDVESARNEGVLLVFKDVAPGRVEIRTEDQN